MSFEIRQDEDLVNRRPVLIVAAVVIVISVAGSLWAGMILAGREAVLRPSHEFPERALPEPSEASAIEQRVFGNDQPAPRRKAGRERLERWGWVDRERGVVHMPIERAMELVAAGRR